MHDVIDPLPWGAAPRYDLSKDYMAFYLTHDKKLEFCNGGEPNFYIECPLHDISVKELVQIREEIRKSIVSGKMYDSCIPDGGKDRGRGLFIIATKGTVVNYK